MNRTIVLATHNRGKVRELEPTFLRLGFRLLTMAALKMESPPETGQSFQENALLKARHALGYTKHWVLAEDSGLVVPALGGEPGIYSARYAGPNASDQDNNQYLLQRLAGREGRDRSAYFHCVMVLFRGPQDAEPLVAEASWQGSIAMEESGPGGFGYDPVFLPEGCKVSAAALSPADKELQSHRGQALRKLCQYL